MNTCSHRHPDAALNPAYADPANPALPRSAMKLEHGRAALLVVDPQIDFLSPDGVSWGGGRRKRH